MSSSAHRLRAVVAATLAVSLATPPPAALAAEVEALTCADPLDERESTESTPTEPVMTEPQKDDVPQQAEEASEPALVEGVDTMSADAVDPSETPRDQEPGEGGQGDERDDQPTAELAEGDVAVDAGSFPDPAFRAWVSDPSNLGGVGADGVLTREERESVTGIHAQRCGIRDIRGIELFPNLKMVDFEYNYIESADLSDNPELTTVYLRNNCLTSIDLSKSSKVRFLEIFDNQLSEVDLSNMPDLEFAHLDWNNLRVIDLSHNTNLKADGFVGNNNPLEKVILPRIDGRSFDSFVISELDDYEGYSSTLPEWYTTPDFQPGTGFTPSTTQDRHFVPFDGQTLYAKRTPNAYTVRFDANGGDGSMASVERVWDDGEQELPQVGFNRLGYRFAGWAKDPDAGATYADRQAVQNIGGGKDTGVTVTLYAVWEPIAESSGFFRSQLGDTERAIYDDLASQLDELTNPMDPSMVEVYVPSDAVSSLQRVLFSVLRDHPEYFWVDFSKLAWDQVGASDVYSLGLHSSGEPYFVDGFTADNLADYRARFEERVEEVVAAAPSDPVLAVRYFNRWLSENNVYNPSGLGATNFSRTAASGILSANDPSTGPVCYGYATAMKVLLDRAGISNAYVEGWAYNGRNGSGEQHAWNYVQVDGTWYAVDPTWNDPASSSAPALETYLLVGSKTVTTPSLGDRAAFGANHDPSRSPAATYRLGYPTLAEQQCPAVATGPFEVVGDSDSVRYDSLGAALAAAGEGQTVRMWDDAELDGTLDVTRDVTIDLGGNGLGCDSAPALHVAADASLRLTNSSTVQGSVSTKGATAAVQNDGALVIDPRVSVRGSGMGAVSGAAPQAGAHAYLVRTTTAYTAYEVVAPVAPAAGSVDAGVAGGTVAELVEYVNGAGRPALDVSYVSSSGQEIAVPATAVPAYRWELVSSPAASDAALARGTYEFRATVFGHEVGYAVSVTDAALDQRVEEGLKAAQDMLGEIEDGVERGLVTAFDYEAARAVVDAARQGLGAASSVGEVDAIVSQLREELQSTPTVLSRAADLEGAWRSEHAATLALVADGSVSFGNAAECRLAADSALAAASTESLAEHAPEGMGAEDRQLVAAMARAQIEASADGLIGLELLSRAAAWAQGAAEALDGLPDTVTADHVDVLQDLADGLDALGQEARRLVSSTDASRLRALLEEAREAAEGSTEDGESPEQGEQPGAPGTGDERPGESGDSGTAGELPGTPDDDQPGDSDSAGELPGAPDNESVGPDGQASTGGLLADDATRPVQAGAEAVEKGAGQVSARVESAAVEASSDAEADASVAGEPEPVDTVSEQAEDVARDAPDGMLATIAAGVGVVVAAAGALFAARRRNGA